MNRKPFIAVRHRNTAVLVDDILKELVGHEGHPYTKPNTHPNTRTYSIYKRTRKTTHTTIQPHKHTFTVGEDKSSDS
eukprot:m.120230 g.120230  ORF g.120230 m.120230 type:complete len:77 (-) comp12916_c0_seq31:1191-1421(-)